MSLGWALLLPLLASAVDFVICLFELCFFGSIALHFECFFGLSGIRACGFGEGLPFRVEGLVWDLGLWV